MLDVIGDLIPFGIGVALSPFPIIAVLLLLTAPVGLGGSSLFLLGRAAGFALLTAVFAVVSDLIDQAAGSSLPAAVLRLALGVVLVGVGIRKFVRRPRADAAPKLPGWMQSIERTGRGGALRLGFVLTVVNPKEIAFAAGAGLTIGGAFLPIGQAIGAGALFVVLACLSVAIPVTLVAVAGARVTPVLQTAKNWLIANNAIVMALVLIVIGAMLIGSGVSGLSG